MDKRAIAIVLGISACGGPAEPPSTPEGSTGEPSDGSTTGEAPPADGTTTAAMTSGGVEAEVTYHEHLRPLVERHCVGCHQPGNIGPFPMTSYQEVYDLREAIVLSVEAGTMPPWQAGPGCRDYEDDTSLSPEEIALVRAWIDEGAAEGSPDDYVPPDVPPPPGMSRVDLTLELPEPYEPVLTPDDYRCFLLDWPYEETRYISGFSAVPDQVHMVHHMIAFSIEPDQVEEFEALDDAEPGVGYTCFGGPGGEIDPLDPSTIGNWLGSWAPGSANDDFPEGTGIAVEPGSRVVLQVHYNTAVDDLQPDQSAVQFKVDEQVEHPAVMLLMANPSWLMGGMVIPAGEPEAVHTWEIDPTPFMNFISGVLPDNEPFRIHAVAQHMHTLGTAGRLSIGRPDGSETCLLELPRWDFNWQTSYRFTESVIFEPGDSLRLSCQWNNEAGEQDVNWGDGTGDEMCLGVFYATAL